MTISENPFDGIEIPDEPKLPVLKVAEEGDTYAGTVTQIGDVFESTSFNRTVRKYVITLELTFQAIKPVKENRAYGINEYNPPAVGEEAVLFVEVGGHIERQIRAALKRAGVDSLERGDNLAIKLQELVPPKDPQHKPFKKHVALVKPTERNADPFGSAGNGDAPF